MVADLDLGIALDPFAVAEVEGAIDVELVVGGVVVGSNVEGGVAVLGVEEVLLGVVNADNLAFDVVVVFGCLTDLEVVVDEGDGLVGIEGMET